MVIYAAGFFDGEGSVSALNRRGRLGEMEVVRT